MTFFNRKETRRLVAQIAALNEIGEDLNRWWLFISEDNERWAITKDKRSRPEPLPYGTLSEIDPDGLLKESDVASDYVVALVSEMIGDALEGEIE